MLLLEAGPTCQEGPFCQSERTGGRPVKTLSFDWAEKQAWAAWPILQHPMGARVSVPLFG